MDDFISRQAAINAADRADYTGLAIEDVKKVTDEVVKEIKKLPSAQSEIVRCKDCKHYGDDHFCCYPWRTTPEEFCSRGERRE